MILHDGEETGARIAVLLSVSPRRGVQDPYTR